jgi:hypothetical protein
MEEEYINGHLTRSMLCEKLQSLQTQQTRLRMEASGLSSWVVLPKGVAMDANNNNVDENGNIVAPIRYDEVLRSRVIPECESVCVDGMGWVTEHWSGLTEVQMLQVGVFLLQCCLLCHRIVCCLIQKLNDTLSSNARILQQVRSTMTTITTSPNQQEALQAQNSTASIQQGQLGLLLAAVQSGKGL